MSSAPIARAGEPRIDLAQARAHGLTDDEFHLIEKLLGRTPTFTELGVFSVMWSEHCSYKSSRRHLKTLPSHGDLVAVGEGENAGAIDVGDGWLAVFKIESHNHPSYVEPYQGAATGVGGIVRDILAMGARPIAVMDSLRFGAAEHPDVGSYAEAKEPWFDAEAEAAYDANDLEAARGNALAAAEAFARSGHIPAAIDACSLALTIAPDDPNLHLLLVELYLDRGWRSHAAEKLALLGRLAELDEDAAARTRLCAIVSAEFTDHPGLTALCA